MGRDLEAGMGEGCSNTPATIRLYVPKSDLFTFLLSRPKPLAPATTPP